MKITNNVVTQLEIQVLKATPAIPAELHKEFVDWMSNFNEGTYFEFFRSDDFSSVVEFVVESKRVNLEDLIKKIITERLSISLDHTTYWNETESTSVSLYYDDEEISESSI